MTLPDLTALTPNARALYWYLVCRGPSVPVQRITQESGIPQSSVYEAAKRFPHLFRLTGSLVTATAPTDTPTTDSDTTTSAHP